MTQVYSHCSTVGGLERKLGEIPCFVPLSTLPTLKYCLSGLYLFGFDFTRRRLKVRHTLNRTESTIIAAKAAKIKRRKWSLRCFRVTVMQQSLNNLVVERDSHKPSDCRSSLPSSHLLIGHMRRMWWSVVVVLCANSVVELVWNAVVVLPQEMLLPLRPLFLGNQWNDISVCVCVFMRGRGRDRRK